MNLRFYLFLIFLNFVKCQNNTLSTIKWISSNFGSSFSSLPCFYDLNHDGSIDMISLSVDGEIICYDLKTGETLINTNWPIYLSNDHFFSKPIIYVYGENYNQESILILSQKGVIYSFHWDGMLLNTVKIDSIFLAKNWSFINHNTINDLILFSKKDVKSKDTHYELYPEIYCDGKILDLNITGVSSDLIIPVNFVTTYLGTNDIIISAIVVFNLNSKSILNITPLKISKKTSESPGYLLTNFDVLDTGTYQLVITSASGTVFKLAWDRQHKKLNSLFQDSLVYNIGPNKCHLTEFCRGSNGTFVKYNLCCIYIDYYGHMAMLDMIKPGSIWEYEFADSDTPTETAIFVSSSHTKRMAYAVFATIKGWVHCVSLLTGISQSSFPVFIKNESFISQPKIVYDSKGIPFILILSDHGNLYKMPLGNPETWQIIIHDKQISSYLSPVILDSPHGKSSIDIIIPSKNGFIFIYELFDLQTHHSRSSKSSMNALSPGYISTLSGTGSTFSFDMQIHDPDLIDISSSSYYIVKVFVNEYLYSTSKEFSTGSNMESHIVVDLNTLDRNLIPRSVFLFGTVRIQVVNHMGLAFPADYFFLRINYDFQFELIWIVYLTFVICIFSILILHFYNDNRKFFIPLYEDLSKDVVIQ